MGDVNRIELDWSDGDVVPAQPANLVQVQGLGTEVILSFGHVAPPIAMSTMEEDQRDEYLKGHRQKVQQIARFTLSEHVARLLMSILQANLGPREADAEPEVAP